LDLYEVLVSHAQLFDWSDFASGEAYGRHPERLSRRFSVGNLLFLSLSRCGISRSFLGLSQVHLGELPHETTSAPAHAISVRLFQLNQLRAKDQNPLSHSLKDITDCPDTGCGTVNARKNIRSLDGEAEPMTIQQMRKLPDPVKGFKVGNTRAKIEALGEGKKIVVVANAIAVRKGGKESCNCGLTKVADTENHIVLVDRVLRIKKGETAKQTLHRREVNSITAEFSPRVRLDEAHLTRTNLAL
jgi:hypothetical protein